MRRERAAPIHNVCNAWRASGFLGIIPDFLFSFYSVFAADPRLTVLFATSCASYALTWQGLVSPLRLDIRQLLLHLLILGIALEALLV